MDYIFNKTSWEPGFDNRPARLYLSQTILKVSKSTSSVNPRTTQDPVSVEPGRFMYSIGGFTVAGAMLEVATNKTFEQLMTEVMRGSRNALYIVYAAGAVRATGYDRMWVWPNNHQH